MSALEVKIYGEEETKTFHLALRDRGSYIVLEAVDENGLHMCAGDLLYIRKDSGKIERCGSVHENIGLPLDEYGRVKFDAEN